MRKETLALCGMRSFKLACAALNGVGDVALGLKLSLVPFICANSKGFGKTAQTCLSHRYLSM